MVAWPITVAVPELVEEIAEFNARVHRPGPDGQPNPRVWARTYDLLGGGHPSCVVHHCVVSRDASGRLIGSAVVIPADLGPRRHGARCGLR